MLSLDESSAFFTRLNALSKGERYALKNSAGKMLQEAGSKAYAAFYRCLPFNTPRWEEERWFAVACLRCLWDKQVGEVAPLEAVVRQMITSGELNESTERKIEVLLDAPWDSDGYLLTKLTRLVKMIRQRRNDLPIDFQSLLYDLVFWNAQNQTVQRKWARTIFINISDNDENRKEQLCCTKSIC